MITYHGLTPEGRAIVDGYVKDKMAPIMRDAVVKEYEEYLETGTVKPHGGLLTTTIELMMNQLGHKTPPFTGLPSAWLALVAFSVYRYYANKTIYGG